MSGKCVNAKDANRCISLPLRRKRVANTSQGKGEYQCSYLLSPINTMVRHLAENALANAKYSVVVLHHEYFALSLCGE